MQAISFVNNCSSTFNFWLNKTGTPDSFNWAHAFRAAYTYYTKNSNWGIQTPPKQSDYWSIFSFYTKIKIGVYSNSNTGYYFNLSGLFNFAQVNLGVGDKNSIGIFGHTIHELGHASHWKLGFTNSDWLAGGDKKKFSESWASGLEWKITNDVYKTLTNNPNFYWEGVWSYQHYKVSQMPTLFYTPLFIDLMDNYNQYIMVDSDKPNDRVLGFTLAQLETALKANVNNWHGVRSYLITNYSTVSTSNYVNYLFYNYDSSTTNDIP